MKKEIIIGGLATLVMSCGITTPPKKTIDTEGVYCVRRTITATNKEGETKSISDNYGSAFVIEQEVNSTLLATAKHVIIDRIPIPPRDYTLTNITYELVDNMDDEDATDDISLTVVGLCDEDVAVMRSETTVPGTPPEYCYSVISGTSYIVGFPYAATKVVTRGIVSSPIIIYENTSVILSDTHVAGGISGGPAYTTNDTGACLYGVAVGASNDYQFSMVLPAKYLSDLENEVLETPEAAMKKMVANYPELMAVQNNGDEE